MVFRAGSINVGVCLFQEAPATVLSGGWETVRNGSATDKHAHLHAWGKANKLFLAEGATNSAYVPCTSTSRQHECYSLILK
ncbi:TPA: hypothetical protein N0F65_005633 [Lagenidium giganteum]|uniref:Secreted protein n=1 Tax=Lagenidium giganteum TaxID=4803 RepID=A0AAV2YT41_9STRA|nr:TPA: hypothetical protein N0F65_005633 [Lagenidium giganteum]